jgi:hypothetical protein
MSCNLKSHDLPRSIVTDQKKIKMIESERASERAGGPARKQEYVVVKKKKLLTYLIMGLYST